LGTSRISAPLSLSVSQTPRSPPDVLAHRNADAHAADRHRSGHLADVKHAFLVEFTVIGQIHLVAAGHQPAAIEHGDRVEPLLAIGARIADDYRRATVGGLGRKNLDRLQAGLQEGGFQHQVLGRITGDEQFGEQHHIRPVAGGVGPGLACLGEIASDIADSRVELGDGDADDVGLRGGFGLGHELGVTPTRSA
jgi:hypothetical protein